jgi:hypothetical protein
MSLITSLQLQQGYPLPSRESGKDFEKVYRYEIDKDLAKSFIPNDYSQDPEGESGFFFKRANTSPGSTPQTLFLDIFYGPADQGNSSIQDREIGTVVQEGSATVSEMPIEKHPLWSNSTFQDEANTLGIKTFLSVHPVYIHSRIIDARSTSFSESLIIEGVSDKGSPVGLNGATPAKWIKTGRSVRREGNKLEIRDDYSYDENEWQTADYGQNLGVT